MSPAPVLVDRDLAALYGVETRVLNQAVKRNANRLPEDFMFRLSRQEIARISQSVTSLSGLKFSKQVHAFTEEGVTILSPAPPSAIWLKPRRRTAAWLQDPALLLS
jgi:hypothetical protein